MEAWCATCVKDINKDCPIVLVGLMGDDPPEWHRGPPWSMQTAIFCTEYQQRPITT